MCYDRIQFGYPLHSSIDQLLYLWWSNQWEKNPVKLMLCFQIINFTTLLQLPETFQELSMHTLFVHFGRPHDIPYQTHQTQLHRRICIFHRDIQDWWVWIAVKITKLSLELAKHFDFDWLIHQVIDLMLIWEYILRQKNG